MRTREEITKDGTRVDILTLEVLLDIRDLFVGKMVSPVKKTYTGKPRGRPRKITGVK